MPFRVCCTIVKYENDIISSCEKTHAFMLFDIPFSSVRTNKFMKTMLKSFHVLLCLSPVCNSHPKGSYTKGATKHSIITYGEIKDSICK